MRNPFEEDDPALQPVLDALDDPDCRAILRQLEEPMTAATLSEACDIPKSTIYRKLELLSEASLVEERIEMRTDGHHTNRYAIDFETVHVALDEDRTLQLTVDRPQEPDSPEDRVAALWEEVRKET
ncbi:helix-turn-helix domain-containing protein [Natronomonas sp. EA1]|uniref:helix-turn-helix domain-containing protein n=1 Tax=Natronomonas sp. EA1 TaxID=3421655 RepID=UPI003EC0188F